MVTTCWRIIGMITTFHIGFNNKWIICFTATMCINTHSSVQYPHREPTLVLVLKRNHTHKSWLKAHHILRLDGEAASRVGPSTELQTMRTVETKMPFYIASVRIWRCNITENFPQLAAAPKIIRGLIGSGPLLATPTHLYSALLPHAYDHHRFRCKVLVMWQYRTVLHGCG